MHLLKQQTITIQNYTKCFKQDFIEILSVNNTENLKQGYTGDICLAVGYVFLVLFIDVPELLTLSRTVIYSSSRPSGYKQVTYRARHYLTKGFWIGLSVGYIKIVFKILR